MILDQVALVELAYWLDWFIGGASMCLLPNICIKFVPKGIIAFQKVEYFAISDLKHSLPQFVRR